MAKDQEFNNRSQGQRIRRANEKIAALTETVAQHDRDIKVTKARVGDHDRDIKEAQERSRK